MHSTRFREMVEGILAALAWPLCVVVALIVFRRPITSLLGRMTRLKIKGVHASFAQQLSDAEHELPGRADTMPSEPRYLQIAEVAPWSGVLEGWTLAEQSVVDAATKLGCFGSPNSYMARRLYERGVLDDALFDVYEKLKFLRNKAIEMEQESIRPAESERYVLIASRFSAELRRRTAKAQGGSTGERKLLDT